MPGATRKRKQEQVEELFNYLDEDGNGSLTLDEFKAALSLTDIDREILPDPNVLPNKGITFDEPEAPALALSLTGFLDVPDFTTKEQGRFRIKWFSTKGGSNLSCIWSTAGTLAEKPVSIWDPSAITSEGGMVARASATVQVGHLGTRGFESPGEIWMLAVKDGEQGMFRQNLDELNRYIATYFPHPIKYRKVWSMHQATLSGSKTLFLWEPIPESQDFIAIGLVATTEEKEPDVKKVHCVPAAWCRRAEKRELKQLWTNAGLGGSRCILWAPEGQGQANLFTAKVGADAAQAPEVHRMEYRTFYSNL